MHLLRRMERYGITVRRRDQSSFEAKGRRDRTMNNLDNFMNEMVVCKLCGRETLYGELTWLNGKCMCPRCYEHERAAEDAKINAERMKDYDN